MARVERRILLLVETNSGTARQVEMAAARAGWSVAHARSLGEARVALGGAWAPRVDLLVAGNADQSPAEIIAGVNALHPGVCALALVTDWPAGLAALRAGAHDLLIGPEAPFRLAGTLAALDRTGAHRILSEKLADSLDFNELVGECPAFRTAIGIAKRAAPGALPILIQGEKGVGKQLVAGAIHRDSPGAARPLVLLNCREIPAGLTESALFGHVRGAFPGAFDDRTGALAQAEGGTLMLDEIEALPLATQQRLLGALETGSYQPLGSIHALPLRARLVAATDCDLDAGCAAGTFREDLLARLRIVSLTLPPLRERIADIAPLARHIAGRLPALAGLPAPRLDEAACRMLVRRDWPGNARELQAVLLRAAIACPDGAVDAARLAPPPPPGEQQPARPGESPVALFTLDGHLRPLDAIEADIIRLAIDHYSGHMSEAARRLGIGRSTLYRKLGDLGISDVA